MLRVKRAYEPADKADGYRILVERLWPRGVSKRAAHLDGWLKDVAPSDRLRRWFGHDPELWVEFQSRYRHELRDRHGEARAALEGLLRRARAQNVTLVYAARDEEHNGALVLKRELERRLRRAHDGRR